ncbi:MAG: mycothiol system anti-sigma-R factor [Corynebacterium sp.]|nr:mycothiol system anti-sigma-R factor [Corynebacterium sp.]
MHESQWADSRPQLSGECGCHDLHVFLYELVDRELTDEDCRRLEAHLKGCPSCAEIVEAETALREVLHRCSCSNAPQSLREKICGELSLEDAGSAKDQ